MALWQDNTLWIVESQQAAYFGLGKIGVQKNKYEDWINYAEYADYEVAWIRMREDLRALNFNSTKAWEFFNSTQGRPYGHQHNIFSFFDTPSSNFPLPFQKENIGLVLKYINELNPEFYQQWIQEGLKKRIGV